jgi:hypothetical protein
MEPIICLKSKVEQYHPKNLQLIFKNIWNFHIISQGHVQNSPARCKRSKCSRDSRFINIYIRLKNGCKMEEVDLMEDKFELEIVF